MIEEIEIRNFKSLEKVKLQLGKFNCLVGMNGAGKSTILQAIDLLSQLMHGYLYLWLDARGWESKDLYCRTGHPRAARRGIVLIVKLRLEDGRLLRWAGSLNRFNMRLTRELIELDGEALLDVENDKYKLFGQLHEVAQEYSGSLLAGLKEGLLSPELIVLRNTIRNIRSLELLSPHLLRKRSRSQDKDIGAGGEKLSGFLATIKGQQKEALLALLQQFYPTLKDFHVASSKGGWKRLVVTESVALDYAPFENMLETDASQLNDGLLRILAMLAQAQTDSTSLLLLDEVENGINPEIVEKLVDTLVHSPVQVMVTSHSPMILNYLDDEVARQAVQFVYKNPHGQTRVRRFFDLPRIGDKLAFMGPGEAFVDTNLVALTQECVALDTAEAFGEAQA